MKPALVAKLTNAINKRVALVYLDKEERRFVLKCFNGNKEKEEEHTFSFRQTAVNSGREYVNFCEVTKAA